MGGYVAITLREPDGKEHRMCRITGVIQPFINNIKLTNKDPAHIQDFLKMWYAMKEDYARHEKKWKDLQKKYGEVGALGREPFEIGETPDCVPAPFLAPEQYGLIVVDMVNNQILDYNTFTGIGSMHSVQIRNDFYENEDGGHTILFIGPESQRPKQVGMSAFDSAKEYSAAMRFRRFFEAGKITCADDRHNKQVIPLSGKTLDEAIQVVLSSDPFCEFPLDMSPFQITRYKEYSPEDAQLVKLKLKELGFELSDEEKRIWAKWIKEHYS